MRRLPAGEELRELVVGVLLARIQPVDIGALDAGTASDQVIRDAFLNVDPFLLVTRSVPATPETIDVLKAIRRHGERVRKDSGKMIFRSDGLHEQSGSLDKTQREHYCKSIALNYRAMLQAGSLLVRIVDPLLDDLYNSRSAH